MISVIKIMFDTDKQKEEQWIKDQMYIHLVYTQ